MKCDAEGFAALYGTVYTDMYRFALCMMKNSHDAEDAVSEAVIQAYEHIGSLRSEESFRSWIFTILANTCRRKWRQQEKDQEKAEWTFFSSEEGKRPGLGAGRGREERLCHPGGGGAAHRGAVRVWRVHQRGDRGVSGEEPLHRALKAEPGAGQNESDTRSARL